MQPTMDKIETPKEEPTTWQYTNDKSDLETVEETPSVETISWTASEFIAHNKTIIWYFALAGVTILVAGVLYLLTKKDEVTLVVVFIIAVIFGFTASRKPRELPYQIDNKGLTIDKKLYSYASFKSFSLVQEAGIESIWLLPLQRFSPGLSIYFAPDQRDKIMNTLSEYLPVEDRKLDMVDTLMHKIRF